ncbi:MAG: DUF1559 domain-containing protein, partial [Thermoguttaceae bacterium]
NFHSAQGSFPPARQGQTTADNTWGHFACLLPFLEQMPLFKRIDFTRPIDDPANSAVALAPAAIFRCPSDTNRLTDASDPLARAAWAKNNYRGNGGNDTGEPDSAGIERNNGVFVGGRRVRIDQIFDGTSNTALFSEGMLGDGDDNLISSPGDWFVVSPASHSREDLYAAALVVTPGAGAGAQYSYAGSTCLSGAYTASRYNHILPPGHVSVVIPIPGSDLAASINNGAQATTASSCHVGGVNLALADGSVRFVRNDVDLLLWRALGSIAGGEVTTAGEGDPRSGDSQ